MIQGCTYSWDLLAARLASLVVHNLSTYHAIAPERKCGTVRDFEGVPVDNGQIVVSVIVRVSENVDVHGAPAIRSHIDLQE